ncbi:imidazolonepropionase [Intrasporangium oryzae NRRL B-24470]|uniref:Imidazolonepropionase n=1 Tax=Intrasporangium oryzae NRRL B-24470 TaxID=1386089 RepID=W9GA68_9MICO|nr:imidazolonepropionase [Intrasporangium oryzae]EWT00769.1 imidazolonepropionase [Intrasporangium oryzae NRRL B-24470]
MTSPTATPGRSRRRHDGSLLITGISELTTNDPVRSHAHREAGDRLLGIVRDAAVVVTDGTIEWVGAAAEAPDADRVLDLGGRAVIPGFVDSHTHLVFAGDRSAEFAARMTGTPYDGGGIAVSVAATRAASDDELRALVAGRIAEMRALGTTTVEIKTGYGLTVEDELRALRIAREFTPHTTFLGAHVVPPEYAADRAGYVDLVTGPMLDAVVAGGGADLAAYLDVFCEPHSGHAFDGDEARAILEAGRRAGLQLRVHGNQLGPGPGVRLACELGAASVDHCTFLLDADVEALAAARGTTVATLLPGVEFSTRSPYPHARQLIDAGVDVALASDCNPGTCYSSSMPFVIALAVGEMHLTPAEALHAATAVAARSLGLDRRVAPGRPAELAVIDGPSHLHLSYRAGMPIVRALDLGAP